MNAQMLLQYFAGGADEKTYIEDVFSTYLYTGNGSTQTITNGIDLAVKGGLVWLKCRNSSHNHGLMDTARGISTHLRSNSTSASVAQPLITSFNPSGFSLNSYDQASLNGGFFSSWTFRNSPKFFICATVVKSAGSNATVDLSSLGTVGMVTVKRTDSTGDWYTWHRSLPAGQLMYLNQTAAASTLGHITVSGTTLTLVNGVIADGTYVVYAWAHDPNTNGVIQCGNFTTDGSGNAIVTTGWEPQYLQIKASSTTGDWIMLDSLRGMPVGGTDARLYANTFGVEASVNTIDPTASGFNATSLSANTTYIYTAIRKGPMRG